MARLGCICGNIMSNTDDPCPYSLDIFYEGEILEALRENPELRWLDLEMGWDELHKCQKEYMYRGEPVEYWFCPECKRVYEVSVAWRRWVRVYRRLEFIPEDIQASDWRVLYVFSDEEVCESVNSAEGELLAKDFVYQKEHPYNFRISADENMVLAFDSKSGIPAFAYELEDKWSSIQEK